MVRGYTIWEKHQPHGQEQCLPVARIYNPQLCHDVLQDSMSANHDLQTETVLGDAYRTNWGLNKTCNSFTNNLPYRIMLSSAITSMLYGCDIRGNSHSTIARVWLAQVPSFKSVHLISATQQD